MELANIASFITVATELIAAIKAFTELTERLYPLLHRHAPPASQSGDPGEST